MGTKRRQLSDLTTAVLVAVAGVALLFFPPVGIVGLIFAALGATWMLPILPRRNRKLTRWERWSICFGVVSGPLALYWMVAADVGYGIIFAVPFFALVLPAMSAGLSRSTQPVVFGLYGNLGFALVMEVAYLSGCPWLNDSDYMGVVALILGGMIAGSLLASLPLYIRARKYLRASEGTHELDRDNPSR